MDNNLDTEGLDYLQWSILDRIVKKTRRNFDILLGYASPDYAKKLLLTTNNSHRIGRAIKLRVLNPKKRMDLIRLLILEGVSRVAISRDEVYFDTDDLKERGLYLW